MAKLRCSGLFLILSFCAFIILFLDATAKGGKDQLIQNNMQTTHIVLSGGFCTGKTTLINRLMAELPIKKLTSYTTRPMRPGEKEGSPYFFLTREGFDQYDAEGKLFDRIEFTGNSYAVKRTDLHEKKQWLLDIVSSSLPTYKAEVPDIISIYLQPASREELIHRARERGDGEEQIEKRLRCLEEEKPEEFDYYLPGGMSLEDKYNFIRKLIIERGCL